MNLRPVDSRRYGLLAALAAAAITLLSAFGASTASAEFGIKNVDVTFTNQDGTPDTQAGSHPYAASSTFMVNYKETGPSEWEPENELKDAIFDQIAGFIGDATAIPRCSNVDFPIKKFTPIGGETLSSCPNNTAVGMVSTALEAPVYWGQHPLYNLEPPPGVTVRLGFMVLLVPVVLDITIKQGGDYNVEGGVTNASQALTVYGSKLEIWGDPSAPGHDGVRGECGDGYEIESTSPPTEFVPGY